MPAFNVGVERPAPAACSDRGLGLRFGADAQHLQRNVIRPAALPGELHQSRATVGRSVAAHRCLEFFFGNDAPKTVGTEKEIVAVLQGYTMFSAVDRYIPSRSQSGGEDVALRVLFGIFGAHDAAFHEPAHVRVIASQTQDARATHQIQAAVSDVRKIKPMAAEYQGGTRGAHAMKGGVPLCIVLATGVI